MSKNYKIEKLEKKHNTTCNEIFKTDDLHQKILVDYMNQKKDLLIFIDVETIGLPIVKEFNNYYHYTDSKKYDSARIVQISWSIYDRSGNELVFRDYVIKPDNFKIPKSSTCIHGIPHAYAKKYGHNLDKILALLGNDISNVKFIVAHNLNFDKNIIYSELYRHNRQNIIQKLEGMVHICTAQTTKDLLKLRIMINFRYINKMPTLAELYTWCFGKPIENAHDSKYDVINLVSIFFYLQNEKGMYQLVDKKDNAFYFGKKKVLLNKKSY